MVLIRIISCDGGIAFLIQRYRGYWPRSAERDAIPLRSIALDEGPGWNQILTNRPRGSE
jgi:hypothetical protein